LLQFSGHETAATCERFAAGRRYVKAFHVRAEDARPVIAREALDAYPNALWMFDSSVAGSFGGTGRAFDWSLVAALARERPLVMSGGLTPANVGACIRAVRPYAVDVRSGIETDGRKDADKMRDFVRAVREADSPNV
jgi:phosphoribosylanthranilate isomerase